MYATTICRRKRVAVTVVTAALFTMFIPDAVAAPKPETDRVLACPIDVHEFTARLRAAGLTAQAAHMATELTARGCRAAGFC